MVKNLKEMEVVVLAAGLGTRMKSECPKVLHQICGESMLSLLLLQLQEAAKIAAHLVHISRINLVVGYKKDDVIAEVHRLKNERGLQLPLIFTEQKQQLGTGHAVQCALNNSSDCETIAVFNGDLPLYSAEAFVEFIESHVRQKSVASLVSAELNDPAHYGRVVRKSKQFVEVVEFKDATNQQRKIKEINAGIYLFNKKNLVETILKLRKSKVSQELYLPDVFSLSLKSKKKIYAHLINDFSLVQGVNDLFELAQAQQCLYQRIAKKWITKGVWIPEPTMTYIGPGVQFIPPATVMPFSMILGKSSLGKNAHISSHCELKDVHVGESTLIRQGTVAEKAKIGAHCMVGPMVHFRPGTTLGDHVRVGNFVEIKEASIAAHTNAAHLSYIGDAEIGERVNLGCGFITCNYDGVIRDGKRKHKTIIGDDVFVGSDSQLVAPIQIANGTYIASGSTITESVPLPNSLVIARTRQVTKSGYAKKYRKK